LSDRLKKSYNDFDNNHTPNLSRKGSINNNADNEKPLAKLLVVDDDPDIVLVLKQGLIKNRFLVTAFINPEEALQHFKSTSNDYCLMLSDIRMPGMSGIQLAREVKKINQDIKIVLMTAFEIKDREFSTVFPSSRVDGFVQKPISIKDLVNKILSIVGQTKRGTDE
jgi:CheY-like chemotaxis protein